MVHCRIIGATNVINFSYEFEVRKSAYTMKYNLLAVGAIGIRRRSRGIIFTRDESELLQKRWVPGENGGPTWQRRFAITQDGN